MLPCIVGVVHATDLIEDCKMPSIASSSYDIPKPGARIKQ